MTETREYDIVLYGATGFVGKLTAEYLARAGGDARIALAGRSIERVRAVRDTLGELARSWPIVAADAAATLLSTTSKTIAGAGPDSSSAPDRYTQPDCAPDSTSAGTSNNGLDFFFVVMSACLFLAGDEIQESRVVLGGAAARSIFPNSLPLRGRVIQIDALPDARQK